MRGSILALVCLAVACREPPPDPIPAASSAAAAPVAPAPEIPSVPVPELGASRPLLFVIERKAHVTPPMTSPTLVIYEDGRIVVERGTELVLGRGSVERAKQLSDEIARAMNDGEWRRFEATRSNLEAPLRVHVRRDGRWFRLSGRRTLRGFVPKGDPLPPALERASARLGELAPEPAVEWKPEAIALLLTCGGTARTTPPPWPAELPRPPLGKLGNPSKAPYVHVVGGEHEARVRALVGESGWTTLRHGDHNCTVGYRRRVPAEDHLDRVIAAFQKTPE
jgi:hypothetical protein